MPQGIPIDVRQDKKKDQISQENPQGAEEVHTSAVVPEKAEKEVKVVKWSQKHIIWLNPSAVKKLQELGHKHQLMDIEFSRYLQPKFSSATDTLSSKLRARTSLDVGLAMYPNIIGIRGRFHLELADQPTDQSLLGQESRHKKGGIT